MEKSPAFVTFLLMQIKQVESLSSKIKSHQYIFTSYMRKSHMCFHLWNFRFNSTDLCLCIVWMFDFTAFNPQFNPTGQSAQVLLQQ